MGNLFGTDGIRGIANVDLTCDLATKVGRAMAYVLLKSENENPTVIIGKDTRLSSDMLECALAAGLCSVGVNVISLGVVPTPAVAFLVRKYNANAGIMISASHNPYQFNGIKIFQGDGYKLSDSLELEIEKIIENFDALNFSNQNIGTVEKKDDAIYDYIDYIKGTINNNLSGLKVAFDCSNGSASRSCYEIFSSLGVRCFMLNDKPNGKNINENCGSVHVKGLIDFVKENRMDAGIAFDGDADRCLAVDNKGNLFDGDFIMAICARNLKSKNKLKRDTVVGTVMTNMGFIKFCRENNLNFVASDVGDRYVLEKMRESNYNFGGEQSGHVIFLDYSTTGDGQLTAVQLLNILKETGGKLSDFNLLISKYPQIIINVEVSNEGKRSFANNEIVKDCIDKANEKLSIKDTDGMPIGRILVRPSGTEPLIRVMLEGNDEKFIKTIGNEVAECIRENIN